MRPKHGMRRDAPCGVNRNEVEIARRGDQTCGECKKHAAQGRRHTAGGQGSEVLWRVRRRSEHATQRRPCEKRELRHYG